VDDSRRRAWAALELGPRWRLRDPVAGVRVDGEPLEAVTVDASTVDAAAAPPRAMLEERERETGSSPALREMSIDAAVPPGNPKVTEAPHIAREAAVAAMTWPRLQETVAGCTACALCEGRRRTVFGVGRQPAPWMVVGEAPGELEDASGEPFVGNAGRLLDQMLGAIGIDRPKDAFITNVLKCRPPHNRDPLPMEVARCEPYLLRQVALAAPRVILVLGRFAAQSLLGTDATISSLRGRVHRYGVEGRDIPLVVTYHPAYLLRTLPDKSKAWADLRLARRTFDAAGD
jgi:DNA polymerase